MKKTDLKFMSGIRDACLIDRPQMRPRDWCVDNLVFDEAGNHGPFKLTGCEYIGEVLDDWADNEISDEVLVWGSQLRKTGALMGGAAWAIKNDPCGFLWMMPSIVLARKFSRQRWMKMLEKSDAVKEMIPTGNKRHNYSTLEMMLGASTINFVGSNSASNASSNPCRRVVLDEIDKFDTGGREEADALNLAEQRTKDMVNPQRWKTSTPTLITGLIWQEAIKGDMRRYFVPCPFCGKQILFAWSPEFTTMQKTGCEAYVHWDKEARRSDGSWDLDRVRKSARLYCPHAGCLSKEITNDLKTKMVRGGEWKPTQPNAPKNFRSRQLSSLYGPSPETSFGALAVKFLQAKRSLLGLQGFINGDLGEPYEMQDKRGARTEIISRGVEITAEWRKLMAVDCQHSAPHFWISSRAFAEKRSEGIEALSAETWDEVEAKQRGLGIKDAGVIVDSGWGAQSDAEVYKNCAAHSEFVGQANGRSLALGWLPSKGMPGRRRWKDTDSGLMVPYHLQQIDPYTGTADAGTLEMSLLEFSADFFKDVLEALRTGKGGFKWAISEQMNNEEYWRHMDGEIKKPNFSPRTGKVSYDWTRRSKYWPNHLFDCENILIAAANFYGFFSIDIPTEETK